MTDELAPKTFIELTRLHAEDPSSISDKITSFYGWVRRTRIGGGGSIVFLDMYDGTRVGSLNCLVEESSYQPTEPSAEESAKLSQDEQQYKTLSFEQLQ